MVEEKDCIICGTHKVVYQRNARQDSSFFMCPVCGRFELVAYGGEDIDRNKLSWC